MHDARRSVEARCVRAGPDPTLTSPRAVGTSRADAPGLERLAPPEGGLSRGDAPAGSPRGLRARRVRVMPERFDHGSRAVGLVWYREADWPRLRALFPDADELP